jgi:predicted O-methyltransferase YrrM
MDFDKINLYINRLYDQNAELTRQEFINKTQLKDFIPVVDDDVARFLKLIIKITKPKRILEIGTSIGYSTTSMAQVVKEYEGQITTVECDETVALQAKQNFINANVGEYIDLKLGNAKEILPSLQEKYDLIFQDADKKLYPLLFNDCLRLLKAGGLLIAEDTLFPVIDLEMKWHDLVEPIRQFNELVVTCPELDSTLLPIGDGVIIAVKK